VPKFTPAEISATQVEYTSKQGQFCAGTACSGASNSGFSHMDYCYTLLSPPKNKLWLIVLSIFTSSLTYSRITPAKQNYLFFSFSHLLALKSLSNISEQGNTDFFLNSNKK